MSINLNYVASENSLELKRKRLCGEKLNFTRSIYNLLVLKYFLLSLFRLDTKVNFKDMQLTRTFIIKTELYRG